MPCYEPDAEFEHLGYRDRKDLINTLNDNASWKQLAACIVVTQGLRRREWIDDVEREANAPNATDSAAELFLEKLRSRNCNVDTLCQWLEACELYDALYIIVGEEELEIVEQSNPNASEILSHRAAIGDTFSITCKARGLPPPKYQWVHGNVEIHGQTSSTFNVVIECPEQEGEYYCKISQFTRDDEILHFEYSNFVNLVIKSTPVEIMKQPKPVNKVALGKDFSLSCEAKGHPSPTYQWYKYNEQLDGENRSTLQFRQFSRDHKGEYYCAVSNACGTKLTDKVEVREEYPIEKATAKIALLIANSDYQHHEKLNLPVNDAALLAKLLKEIGFTVICLQNLTLKEMRNSVQIFCSALKEGAYGFFYFAGHGFKMTDFFMMPIDHPKDLSLTNAYSADEFLLGAIAKNPALPVVVLDMCLTVPDKASNPGLYKEKPKISKAKGCENLILAYSTNSNNPSYEGKTAINGVYVSHLKNHIPMKKPVNDVFTDTARDVTEWVRLNEKVVDQKPMITTIPGGSYRCLTDATIHEKSPSEYELGLSNIITFKPKKSTIEFEKCEVSCGITIKWPNPPYINVMLLTTSGLDKYDVSFHNSAGNEAKLVRDGRKCWIYNPQRIPAGAKKSLVIEIGKNGVVHDSVHLPYLKWAPKLLHSLWNDVPESFADLTST